ncbi:unnamed protein product [Microthlaspi erraticum]|uniref:UBX domain-containing protein n=1 Tax=Microthlaspi erraticum TaxID=1685480 RepID=A0A6D2IJ31_9BRAS|nr:unnamed protein product [Microthlaspi erraticum]
METATSVNQHELISSFIDVAVGQTMETATRFLKATSWNLEEAINLFLIHGRDQPLCYQNSSEKYWRIYQQEEEKVPLPKPSIRDTLYDSSSMSKTPVKVCPEEIWEPDTPEPSGSASVGSDVSLFSLYRSPLKLLFQGTFEDAKSASSRKDLWLLVNLQSKIEFASHALNRDLWSNEAVSQAIESSFTLCQVYDDTTEGQKISTFYKIESAPPVVLLIDPVTGQKMRSWSGVIEAQGFVEDLMKYIDAGPHEHIASLTSNKRIKTERISFPHNNKADDQDMATFFDKDFKESSEGKILKISEKEESCSSSNHIDHIMAPSWGEEFEESAEVEEEETCLEEKFPVLTEEPKGDCDRSIVCSLCVRFPDGRRKQRKFLKAEPIQLLWSFCDSLMEASEKKAFKLVQAIPGASKTLDYGDDLTFDESGIANSMISVTWE